jgi:hypothetical protein
MITKRVVLMSQFDDDEERETVEEAKKTRGYYNERQY